MGIGIVGEIVAIVQEGDRHMRPSWSINMLT
jgi:hypothetical protein